LIGNNGGIEVVISGTDGQLSLLFHLADVFATALSARKSTIDA
jgi:hypothetical protein